MFNPPTPKKKRVEPNEQEFTKCPKQFKKHSYIMYEYKNEWFIWEYEYNGIKEKTPIKGRYGKQNLKMCDLCEFLNKCSRTVYDCFTSGRFFEIIGRYKEWEKKEEQKLESEKSANCPICNQMLTHKFIDNNWRHACDSCGFADGINVEICPYCEKLMIEVSHRCYQCDSCGYINDKN